jgi:hypothetical protein
MSIIKEITAAGWDPFNPSDECRRSLRIPTLPSGLPERDIWGIRHSLAVGVLSSRFARGKKDTERRRDELDRLASLFVIRMRDPSRVPTAQEVEDWYAGITLWRSDVLAPSEARLRNATSSQVEEDPFAYAPASVLACATARLGLVDVEKDRLRIALGQAMHEQGKKHPKEPDQPTLDEMIGHHILLSNEGCVFTHITEAGKLVVVPKKIKSGLDAIHRGHRSVLRQQRREKLDAFREVERPKRPNEKPSQVDDLPDLAEKAADSLVDLQRLRAVVCTRMDRRRTGTARWHVLRNFRDILTHGEGQRSARALAKSVGMDEGVIRQAWNTEAGALRKFRPTG